MRNVFALVLGLTACVPHAPPERDGATLCGSAEDCQDESFCNGREQCAPADPRSDANGCLPGESPCERGCSEAGAGCADCMPADADGDGWAAVACGGPDCDDADPNRFPDNVEVCDADAHDEDCNLETYGRLDLDADGEVWSGCCNEDGETQHCGLDCDDTSAAVGTFGTEQCNGRDDDCDLGVDEGVLIRHYADLDGDGFGDDTDSVLSCSASGRHMVVRGGDCDDGRAEVSPLGSEVCNGHDDDCNGAVDDGDALVSCMQDGVRDAACESGVCVIACELDRADCDVDSRNGCEADLNSTETCGGCDVGCEPRPHGLVACVEHVCTQRWCDGGALLCDGRCVRQSTASCGDDCAPCPEVANGRMNCLYSDRRYQCIATCDPGYGRLPSALPTVCLWADASPIAVEVLGRYLVPAFREGVDTYRVDVPHDQADVRVRVALRSDAGPVAIALNGEPLAPGVASAPVPVGVGETFLYVDTLAEAGTSRRYNLQIVRASGATP